MASRTFSALVILAAPLLAAAVASADITLTSGAGPATANIDPNSSNGMDSWTVQGQQQLFQQWFWYRIGDTGPESPINTISAPAVSQPTASTANITYTGTGFSINISYQLTGGVAVANGSFAQSDIAETITINNLSNNPLNMHFFQYSDFDLDGQGNDNVQLVQVPQIGNPLRFGVADQWDGPTPVSTLTETVLTPKAGHGEANTFANTLTALNDGLPTTLSDVLNAGPGDVTWALEWDYTGNGGTDYAAIAPNSSEIISKDKKLSVLVGGAGSSPEPASVLTLVAGSAALLLRRRRSPVSR